MSSELASLSIKELRALITESGLTTAGCVDKSDLLERAAEAQVLASSGAAAGGPNAEAIEEEIAALQPAELITTLESVLRRTPSQETALRANACFQRIAMALMEGEEFARDRLLPAILGGMIMGLGGQGGLVLDASILRIHCACA